MTSLSVAPDGRSVWFTRESAVLRVDLPDGQPQAVAAPGQSPAVSPDGTRVACARPSSAQAACADVIVVRDLAPGRERAWAPAPAVSTPSRVASTA